MQIIKNQLSSRLADEPEELGSHLLATPVPSSQAPAVSREELQALNEALRESEVRLQLALEATGLGVFDWDLTTDRVLANARFREMFGLSPDEELSGQGTLNEPIHPEDRDFVNEQLARAFGPESEGRYEFEFRALTSRGEVWLLTSGKVYFEGEGNERRAFRVVGNGLDVTRRKHAEEQLRSAAAFDAYRVALSDALRPLANPIEIQAESARVLGEKLKASRAFYFETEGDAAYYVIRQDFCAPGIASVLGRHRAEDFGVFIAQSLREGRTFIVNDVASQLELSQEQRKAYLKLDIAAYLTIPLLKNGRHVASIAVHQSTPRTWTPEEIALVEETGERTWAAVERAKAEKIARESGERLQLALDAANMGTFVWYPLEDRAEWDERMWALFGRTTPEPELFTQALVQVLTEFIHPEDSKRYSEAVKAALAPDGSGTLREEIRVIHPDGSQHWLSISAQAYYEEGLPRRAIRMTGTATDITESKRGEEELRESQAGLQAVTDIVPDLLWSNDTEGITDWFNQQWFNYTGQSPEEARDYGWLNAVHPDERATSLHNFQGAVDRGEPLRQEHRIRRHDGQFRWFLVRAQPLRDEAGRIVRWYGAATDIHEERMSREAVQQSEERFRTLISKGSDMITVSDQQGRIVYASDTTERVTGHSPSEFMERHPFDSIFPEDRARCEAALRELAATPGLTLRLEHRILHKDGTWRWVEGTFTSLFHESAIGGLVANVRDITERKEAEEALQASEAQLAAIFEQATVGLSELSLDGRYLRVNDELCRILGRSKEQVLTLSVADATFPEDIPHSLKAMARVLEAGEPQSVDKRCQRPDGSTVWTNNNVALMRDEHGEPHHLLAVTVDLTERKQVEEALQASEAHLAAIFEQATVGLSEIALDGRFLRVNDEVCRLLQRDREEVLALGVLDVTHPEDVVASTESMRRLVATGETQSLDERYIRADGSVLWANSNLTLLRDVRGQASHVLAVTVDLTERLRAEEAVRHSEERLRLMVQSITEYAIMTTDKEGIITSWNVGAERVFGWSAEEIVGQTTDILFTPEDQASGAPLKEREQATETGRSVDERWHVRKDDSRFFASGVMSPVRDGEQEGYVKVARDLTRERQDEAALRESEARFRTVTDAVPQIIWANEANGYANFFNGRWYEYSGLTREQSLGLGWQKIVHPDDEIASVEAWQRALEAGEVFDIEYRLRRSDGVYRWHIGRNVPLRNEEGRILGWFGSATDIEELKEAQQTARESEERLRIAIDAGELGTWQWDVLRNEIHWNERQFLLFGMTPHEGWVGTQHFASRIHPDDYADVIARLSASVENTSPFEAEFRIVRDDSGEVRWMNSYGRPIEAHGGRSTRMSGVMFDSTERREAQEVLRRSHEELETRVQERTHELGQALKRVRAEVEQRRQAEAGRNELMRRIVNTQEEERGRISRELHDNLGQHLTAMLFGLQALEMQVLAATDNKNVVPQLDNLRQLLDALMKAAHSQARELRPAELDAMGLEAALGQYIRDWSTRTGVEVDFQAVGWEKRPAIEVETTLYRVAQEALTNVARHANATLVSVVLEQTTDTASIIVEDDGRGFDSEQAQGRLGVLGMKERLALVDGTLEIESIPDEGTAVFARVPLPTEQD